MTRILSTLICLVLVLLAVHPAAAQVPPPYPATSSTVGDRYHVEVSAGLWYPTPSSIFISSQQLGVIGTRIDGISDLGFVKTRFSDLRIVLRPAKKHKFHIDYAPIHYQADAVLRRDVTFNGTTYHVGVPVNSTLTWKAWDLGYEYDFLYRERWFAGFIVQARWTAVDASLASPVFTEQAHAQAPVPAIGGIVRGYVTRNVAITGQVTGFKLPESVDSQRRFEGRTISWDIGGTFNFTDNIGAEIGYRSFDVDCRINSYTGDFKLGGLYFGAVGRF